MDLNNIKIETKEVLRYLGYSGQRLDENTKNNIEQSKKLIRQNINLKYTIRRYKIENIEEGVFLKEANFILMGNDIKKHLALCDECILMAVTLGYGFERLVRLYEKKSLAKSIIIDSCGTTAIEEACDLLEELIRKNIEKENKYITTRYSPGYGDLSIEIQNDFINLLNCQKEIGLTCSENNILIPRKSVTAIIGVTKKKTNSPLRKCAVCLKNKDCLYRRKDENYGYITI